MKGRETLREYYDRAAPHYLDRASKGMMGWLRRRELAITHGMLPEGNGRKALDAGCGPGYYSQVMRERGFDVTAVDLSPEMVRTVNGLGIPAYQMDIEHSAPPTELPAPFDFVFCAGVLEFANDVRKFLRSLRRLTADGGELVLIAPLRGTFGFFYRTYLESRGIPARCYGSACLHEDLQAVGFEPVETRAARPICLAVRARAAEQR